MIKRFFLVGAISTVVDFSVYSFMVFLGFNYIVAIIIGYSCGFLVNFFLVRNQVFKKSRFTKSHYEFLAVLAVSLVGVLLNIAIVWILAKIGFNYYIARVISIITVFFFNYYARKGFIYVA